jgi:hypothetical protein
VPRHTGASRKSFLHREIRTGGTLEQYKHPCLINDPDFRSRLPAERAFVAGGK